MSDEIELVGDDEGVVVLGDRSAIERYLDHIGLLADARAVDLSRLRSLLTVGSDAAEAISGIVEQSSLYLKLTPESAQRLKEAGGLIPTKTKGVSWAMLGEVGQESLKWLEVQDGPASLLLNPAVLSGVGGLLAQFAQQTEAQELKALLVGIDEKLDDVRRAQRDQVLARVQGAANAIEEAITIREHGGDPQTLWDKVSSVDKTIKIAQDEALRALGALAAKVEGRTRAGELKKATHEIEQQAVIWLSVLARCTQLQDEFGVIELDHVLATAAGHLEGHRLGLAAAREIHRARLLETTRQLVAALQNAGAAANENIVLHRWSAQAVIESLNATVAEVDNFHAPLRIERSPALTATPWRQAIRDPQQRKTAGKEVAQKGVVVAGAAVAAIGAAALVRGSDDERGTE